MLTKCTLSFWPVMQSVARARCIWSQLAAHVDKLKPRSNTMNGGKGQPLLDLAAPPALSDARISSGKVRRINGWQYRRSSPAKSLEFRKNLMANCLSLPSFSRANCKWKYTLDHVQDCVLPLQPLRVYDGRKAVCQVESES